MSQPCDIRRNAFVSCRRIVFMLDFGGFAMVCGTAVLMLFWCWTMVDPETQEKAETREMERAM